MILFFWLTFTALESFFFPFFLSNKNVNRIFLYPLQLFFFKLQFWFDKFEFELNYNCFLFCCSWDIGNLSNGIVISTTPRSSGFEVEKKWLVTLRKQKNESCRRQQHDDHNHRTHHLDCSHCTKHHVIRNRYHISMFINKSRSKFCMPRIEKCIIGSGKLLKTSTN